MNKFEKRKLLQEYQVKQMEEFDGEYDGWVCPIVK